MDPKLIQFFGGSFLIQQWSKKRKLFQTVHQNKPNNFYLYKQRFIYSMEGFDEECTWLYIANFYQEIFNKIKHPLFDFKNKNGKHELNVYVDAKLMLVYTPYKIMWAPFKNIEENVNGQDKKLSFGTTPRAGDQVESFAQTNRSINTYSSVSREEGPQRIMSSFVLDIPFKNVFSSLDTNVPEFIQIFQIGNEGYLQKEIIVVCEFDDKISVLNLRLEKQNKKFFFKISENFKFDKFKIGVGLRDVIHNVQIVNISDMESIFLMTREEGELKILTEQHSEVSSIYELRRRTLRSNVSAIDIEEHPPQKLNNDGTHIFQQGDDEAVIILKSHFARRNNIYFEEKTGVVRRLNSQDCKLQSPLNRCVKVGSSKNDILLQDLSMHLAFYSDYLIANTAVFLSHGKILSIYDFKTMCWSHVLPDSQIQIPVQNTDFGQLSNECYFGEQDEEIDSLLLNHIFQNSIYDALILYKNQEMRRVKYFNECQKTIFEKTIIFNGNKVKQKIRNYDMFTYRQFGDIVERTYFLIQNIETNMHEIWVSENGSRMTKLVRNITEKIELLNLQNSSSDLLAIYEPVSKKIIFYSLKIIRKCFDYSDLKEYTIDELHSWVPHEKNLSYFYFNRRLYTNFEGNLVCYKIAKQGTAHARKEYNFKSSIRDFYMTDQCSVYYKDKNNFFRYINIKLQKKFDVSKFPTKVMECNGAFITKMNFCFATNRFSLFTSPFEIAIIPSLCDYSLDLLSSMNFEQNFLFWKQSGSKLFAFKQPNIVVEWDLDSGKVIKSTEQQIYIKGFQKHSEWNGCTLLKYVQNSTIINDDDYPKHSREYDEEKRQRTLNPKKTIFSLVDINDNGIITEICRFLYEQQIGQTLYVSFPYLLIMNDHCAKFYSLETKDGRFKVMRIINQFYEPQMKVGKPIYFSPDFQHRLYVEDTDNQDKLYLNYTLTNVNLTEITILPWLMWQNKGTHPMIYFHDNNKIVYLTEHGIEKVFEFVKEQKKKRTIVTLKEIANCYYTPNDLVLRMLYDQYNYKQDMGCSIKHLHMLRIRAQIIKRGLMLNEYLLDRVEEKKENMKREYPDKNIGNFSSLIIDNYRRELNFSYITWKLIEQISHKKLHINQLKQEFVLQLVYTILPNQETILHYLNDNYEDLQAFLKVIYDDAELVDLAEDNSKGLDIEMDDVPFLPNLLGKTPLHKAVEKNNTRFTDRILTVLADTNFDHHSRFIINTLHHLVDQVPAAFQYYLDNKQETSSWIEKYTRGKIIPVPDCDFTMISSELWCEDIDTKLSAIFTPTTMEVPMTMWVLDLPDLLKFDNKYANKFMNVLSETENIEIFNSRTIRAIIELKWPYVKKAMVRRLFYPYIILLSLFIYYAVYLFETIQNYDSSTNKSSLSFWVAQEQTIRVILFLLVLYFYWIELRSCFLQGPAKYLSNPWNYIDIFPLLLITYTLLYDYIVYEQSVDVERAINSLSTFLLWIKFLYFLRIFRQSSKFISMIVAVIADMRIFLAVFVISLVTFSQSMYIISNNQTESEQFITSNWDSLLFAYKISLGSWDVSGFGTTDYYIMVVLFLISTLFLCIIMLNLLIAVISDTYARVDASAQNQLYKNFADLIMENEYLVPYRFITDHDSKGSYLYIAKLDQNLEETGQFERQLHKMKNMITLKISALDRMAQDLSRHLGDALKHETNRMTQYHIEENIKSDIFYKQAMRKLDQHLPKHMRETSETREYEQSRRKTTGRKSGRVSARPASTRQEQQQKQQQDKAQ